MKAEYKDGALPGEGYIVLSEGLLPGAPWAIAVQRASDKLFLTGKDTNPWVGDRIFLPVSGTVRPDGALQLAIGPNVVDQLDQRDQYRLVLQGDGEELPGRLRIGQIAHSRGGNRQNTGHAPGLQAEPQGTAEPSSPVSSDAPPAKEKLGPLQMGEKPMAAPRRGIWRWLILTVLLLGCLAWYLLDQRKGEGENTPPTASEQKTPAQDVPQSRGAEEQVRQFFRDGVHSPGEAADLAARLPRETPADQDAVYRLWYFAAENGEPAAYLPYARILDPSEPGHGSIEKNAPEAWAMYEKAQETRPEESTAARAKLRQYLQDKAAMGDARARAWLLQIDQPR